MCIQTLQLQTLALLMKLKETTPSIFVSKQDQLSLPAALQHFMYNLNIFKIQSFLKIIFKILMLHEIALMSYFPPRPPAFLWTRQGVPKTEATFFHSISKARN